MREIMQETTPGARMRGRQRTAWMDNITWTGLSVEESIRTTKEWTQINGESTSMVWPTLDRGRLKTEQNIR